MTVTQITQSIEQIAPLTYAEGFDNVGLLVGNYEQEVSKVLVSLDCLESVVDEAIAIGAELIVCFHPIVFKGLKKFNGSNYVERVVIKAIQNNIAIYAMHTALDNSKVGVNKRICDQLGLNNTEILIPKSDILYQLSFRVPLVNSKEVLEALFQAGAGSIDPYSECAFETEGQGSFKALEGADPHIGSIGSRTLVTERQIQVSVEAHVKSKVLKALHRAHPYEKVAYELLALENSHPEVGMGMIGELDQEQGENTFLKGLKTKMNTAMVRHSNLLNRPIKKVAVLGGSGVFALKAAIARGADAFVSADFKYHDFFLAENRILICDIGHYESEQFTKELLVEHLKKNFPNFAVVLSSKNTNPIHYI